METEEAAYEQLEANPPLNGTFVYSIVAQGQIILAESSMSHGNFPEITRVLLSKISHRNHYGSTNDQSVRKSFIYDKFIFNYEIYNGIIFLVSLVLYGVSLLLMYILFSA